MAVVVGTYIRRGAQGNGRAKDAVKYLQHRPERTGERITRPLFGPDGVWERLHGYQMIDEAPAGTHFYRMSINPDPAREDHRRDLDLREVTAQTMRELRQIVSQPVLYVAAVHTEHADARRHVSLLASVPRRLNAPELKALTAAATQACRAQRLDLDRALTREVQARERAWEVEREREEDRWGW